ncbi:MAG: hypothetical protein ACOCTR_04240 [Candidatus Natronoplasma sp.]
MVRVHSVSFITGHFRAGSFRRCLFSANADGIIFGLTVQLILTRFVVVTVELLHSFR